MFRITKINFKPRDERWKQLCEGMTLVELFAMGLCRNSISERARHGQIVFEPELQTGDVTRAFRAWREHDRPPPPPLKFKRAGRPAKLDLPKRPCILVQARVLAFWATQPDVRELPPASRPDAQRDLVTGRQVILPWHSGGIDCQVLENASWSHHRPVRGFYR